MLHACMHACSRHAEMVCIYMWGTFKKDEKDGDKWKGR